MQLAPGKQLGPHEITATPGAGGMGEVYSARDTRLEQTVAIKILWQLSSDPVRKQRWRRGRLRQPKLGFHTGSVARLSRSGVCRQGPNTPARRFEREAKAISCLNHPNICVLHDIGHQDGDRLHA
jgi:serine/threonine protein kinase